MGVEESRVQDRAVRSQQLRSSAQMGWTYRQRDRLWMIWQWLLKSCVCTQRLKKVNEGSRWGVLHQSWRCGIANADALESLPAKAKREVIM